MYNKKMWGPARLPHLNLYMIVPQDLGTLVEATVQLLQGTLPSVIPNSSLEEPPSWRIYCIAMDRLRAWIPEGSLFLLKDSKHISSAEHSGN